MSFNNRKKKTRRQRTNETGLSFGMQHNKIEEGQRRRISMLQHLMMSKRVDGFCTPFNIEEEEEKSPFYFEKRRARSWPFFFLLLLPRVFPLSHDDIVTTKKKKTILFFHAPTSISHPAPICNKIVFLLFRDSLSHHRQEEKDKINWRGWYSR